jgi:hypothetical protein
MLSDLLLTFVWLNKNIHVYRRISTLVGLNERKNRILSATELQGDLELLAYCKKIALQLTPDLAHEAHLLKF